ncbi:PEP-CTERM sorting domain-containing protein [Verrucomicrobiaceae bacterium N1E253]|uniref:PEP-CTERM sorting domain-containing protein n=1 Tax=Oceaniferula marina TaxID=2748318 RepID=A0A851GJ92_9BACT|nr:PEP-CTERM sorting domain-containing protein [Oceaniferula marina]NWK55255.1 PEP-CTERM sorting domain-containing protein [Oceaniferula marina]
MNNLNQASTWGNYMTRSVSLTVLGLALSSASHAAVLVEYPFAGSLVSTDSSIYSSVSTYDVRSAAIGAADDPGTDYDDDSAISGNDGVFMRAQNTPTNTSPVGVFYHSFSMTVQNLGVGEILNLTTLDFKYYASRIDGTFSLGLYSDAVGYTGTGDKLTTTTNINANEGSTFSIDLTSTNTVAGTAFTGLTNGDTIDFRFYFADNASSINTDNQIHRLDDISINGVVTAIPEPSSAALLGLGLLTLCNRRRR